MKFPVFHLKPCNFCGGTQDLATNDDGDEVIRCTECGNQFKVERVRK